ncbi:hypothetical protein FACS1894168_0330 [Deltaproteobacteria bacterium]|nr:hypothetical protein FACS1894168_0330 [Deltaproteobacteria bacterium]
MRWIKHPCNFSRSAAMSEVREKFGPAGYGAVWLILERIAEDFGVSPQKTEPDLCLSEKEWRYSSGFSTQKLKNLLEILQNHSVILVETGENRIRLQSPILAQLLDEWTKRARKNSGAAPVLRAENPGSEQTTEQKGEKIEKDKKTEGKLREQLRLVLKRHDISDPDRENRIIRHMERKTLQNPGGYLEKILQQNPAFDPQEETTNSQQTGRSQEPQAIGDILRRAGYEPRGEEQ